MSDPTAYLFLLLIPMGLLFLLAVAQRRVILHQDDLLARALREYAERISEAGIEVSDAWRTRALLAEEDRERLCTENAALLAKEKAHQSEFATALEDLLNGRNP